MVVVFGAVSVAMYAGATAMIWAGRQTEKTAASFHSQFASNTPDDPAFNQVQSQVEQAQSVGFTLARIIPIGFMALVLLIFCLGASTTMLGRIWLDGTTLASRGLRTRRIDLSTAVLSTGTITHIRHRSYQPVSHGTVVAEYDAVFARDPVAGIEISVPIGRVGSRCMPRDELIALSNAMLAGRDPAAPGTAGAIRVARGLRTRAGL